ncbi:hypothetical protein [Porphyromonas gingivalis]|uniref:hypothetical protein n=1 Tax=Porphyromonas gingivalis TaxID=837 RepID=UPI0003AD6334|nr:hypothetical protein [Porphyromonas gingivalis]ERJ65868.1 hypothetical protein HMPREF1553_02019 [Porphyromonas gingivalis F0568]MCE8186519.1 hypothetical protein [Porphyromonas gingivalis]
MYKDYKGLYASLRWCALIIGLLFAADGIQAQNNNFTESPYTRFGLGRLGERTTISGHSMGGLGVGLRQGTYVNAVNPASYSAVDSMTFIFDFGASTGITWYAENGKKDNRKMGNIEYFAMLFPISKSIAMSAGVLPYSASGYQFGSVDQVEGGSVQYTRKYLGTGNLNDLYVGIGATPFKNFSIGANASFLFGRFTHSRQVIFSTEAPYNPVHLSTLYLKAAKFDFGMQYHFPLKSDRSLVIGAVYSPRVKMHSELTQIKNQVQNGVVVESETQEYIKGMGYYTLPHTLGIGFSYEKKDKLLLGADVQYSKWKGEKFYKSDCKFQDRIRVSLGGEIIPDINAVGIWPKVRYRFGLHGENSYLKVPTKGGVYQGYHIVGAVFGIGIPLNDRRSFVNVSLEYDRLIPKEGMIKENALKLTFGLTFNESWFKKLKLN